MKFQILNIKSDSDSTTTTVLFGEHEWTRVLNEYGDISWTPSKLVGEDFDFTEGHWSIRFGLSDTSERCDQPLIEDLYLAEINPVPKVSKDKSRSDILKEIQSGAYDSSRVDSDLALVYYDHGQDLKRLKPILSLDIQAKVLILTSLLEISEWSAEWFK